MRALPRPWMGLLFILALHDTAQAETPESTQNLVQKQALVRIKSESESAGIQKKIPNDFEIADAISNLIIIRKKSGPLTELDIQKINKIPGVQSVLRDSVVHARKIEDCPECDTQYRNTNPVISGNLGGIFNTLQPTHCELNPSCPNDTKTPRLWAQKRVDGDLMLDQIQNIKHELNSKGQEVPETRICSIDSGFDLLQHRSNIASPNFEAKSCSGFPSVISGLGNPEIDETGHGTAIAGLMGGKDGIGLAPNLSFTVYRVTAPGSNHDASNAQLIACIERASKQGCDVINLSWGSEAEEKGTLKDSQRAQSITNNPTLLKSLTDEGSLLVNASGNEGYRVKNRQDNPDDAILRVAATDPSGDLSDFSTDGEIAAPGSKITTLASAMIPNPRRCSPGDSRDALFNGTSYGGPIAAAIAGQISWVLKTNPAYQNMSSEKRLVLLNRVLFASRVGKNINGLRAVLIAKNWANSVPKNSDAGTLSQNLPDTNELKKFLNRPALKECSDPTPQCTASVINDCEKYQSCFQQNRLLASACEPTPTQSLETLIDMTLSSSYPHAETAAYWYSLRNRSLYPSPQVFRLWNALNANSSSYKPSSIAGALFTDLMRLSPANANGQIQSQSILEKLLSSASSSIESDIKKNHEDSFPPIIQALKDALYYRGPGVVFQALANWIDHGTQFNESGELSPRSEKILSLLMSEPEFASMQPRIRQLEKFLYSRYSENFRATITSTEITDPLFKREQQQLSFSIQNFLQTGRPTGLGSHQIDYIIRNLDSFSLTAAQKKQFHQITLQQIEKNQGWSGSNTKVATAIFTQHVKDKNWTELERIASSTNHPHIATALLNSQEPSSSMPQSYIDKLNELSRRFALATAKQSKSSFYDNATFSSENLLPLLSQLSTQDQNATSSQINVPLLGRHGSPTFIPDPVTTQKQNDPGAAGSLDTVVTSLFLTQNDYKNDIGRQAPLNDSIIAISKSPKILSALKNLPASARWKELAKKAQKDAQTNPSFNQKLIEALEKILK